MLTAYAIFLARRILMEQYGVTLADIGIAEYETDQGPMVDEFALDMNRLRYYWSADSMGLGSWEHFETPILIV